MHITLAMVSSVNGKITMGTDPHIHAWTSDEDQAHFKALVQTHTLIIMGRKTYEAAKAHLQLSPGKLRIVYTQHPHAYTAQTVINQLEFANQAPKILIAELEKKGYTEALLVGGSEINMLFLKENLISKIILTIEPYIIGSGQPLFTQIEKEVNLQLIESTQINKKGTLILTYTVLKPQ